MNNKLKIWLPLLFSLVMIIGMFMGYKMRDAMPGKSFFSTQKASSVQEILDLLNSRYVDSVNVKSLSDTAIEAILSKLDPHSVYIPAEDLQQINEEIQGSFFGIGVEFNMLDDSLHIINVLEGGPSDKAGLKTGDIMLKAGDSIISGKKISIERIRNILRGPEDTKISLSILRNGKKQITEVGRGNIPIKSIDVAYMLDTTNGYIKINKFSTQTYKEFMNSLLTLKKAGMKGLVLDLRGNGGGVLDEAVEIADELLEGDKLITYTEGLHSPKKEFRCRRQGQFEQGNLVILADEGSASASEVLMGALQDWDRAVIIGRRTFGKGLVQEQYDLRNSAALRLTVARYYTPIGRSIQRSYKDGTKSYYTAISDRFTDGEMVTADSVKNDTSKIYRSQKGKKLFGGGGITPDFFIPADTGKLSLSIAKIYSRGTLADFGYRYYKNHQSEFSVFKNSMQFAKNFEIKDAEWKYFEALALKDSISVNSVTPKEKESIEKVLKASLARQIFRTAGYYETINSNDDFIRKALTVIK
jgi:carboxyl-terminal processing protease